MMTFSIDGFPMGNLIVMASLGKMFGRRQKGLYWRGSDASIK